MPAAKKTQQPPQTHLEDRIRGLEEQKLDIETKYRELERQLSEQCQLRTEAERRLAIQPQTGLPTHYRMDHELKDIIDKAAARKPFTVFAVAIIQLSPVYDTLKRTLKSAVTDWILYQASIRIKEVLAEGDPLFHTRENEFISVIQYAEREELEATLRRIVTHIAEPIIFSGFNLTLGANLGAAIYPSDGDDKATLLHNADIALGAAIDQKKPHAYYTEELKLSAIERIEMQNSIIKAIEAPAMKELASQFDIFYQPKVVIDSIEGGTVTARAIDAEALIRWHHPVKGLMPPDRFISIAEETGLIMPIGKWLLFQLSRTLRAWDKRGLEGIQVSVNLSPRQFRSIDIIETFKHLIERESLIPDRITIEVTETSLFEEPRAAERVIEQFKELGFRISVDDFGTGYSSLSHLHRFPLDEIKIDKSFIQNYPAGREDFAIVNSLASIATNLGYHLVAEGVERMDQLEALQKLGCSIQGYIFSRPMPEKDFTAWVEKAKKNGMKIALSPQDGPSRP